jgi:peroxiredoxin
MRMSRLMPVAWFLAVGFLALSSARSADNLPVDRNVGKSMQDFTLKSVSTGNPVRMIGFAGKKAAVLVFTGTACPVSDAYFPRLEELSKAYESKGVVFLAINSNAHESVEEVAKHAKERGITFQVLKDPKNLVADMALVQRTPEVLVLDGRARIRYRGAIDDQFMVGKRKPKAEKEYVKDALDSILENKPIAVAATEVQGCLLDRVEPVVNVPKGPRVRGVSAAMEKVWDEHEKTTKPFAGGRVNYTEHVAPILQAKCQSCHRPTQVAPFSLLTYEDAKRWSGAIAEAVEERRMPPWHADPRFGHFANDRSLTLEQREILMTWIDQDTPEFGPKKTPAPANPKFSEGWTIGKPDVVFEIPEPYTVPAQGEIAYVNIRVPTNFKEDKWIQAAEAVPGDKAVVHHIIGFVIDGKGGRRRFGDGHLCGYAPGDMPSIYPPGVAKKIPAGADLLFQIHYTPNGKVHMDRSKIGLIFAKEPVKHEAHTLGIATNRFVIKAGDDNSEVNSSHQFSKKVHVLSFMPHMHLRGKDFKYTLVKKVADKEQSEILLSVPAYDFGWQSYYTLNKPLTVEQGWRIDCVAHFDNSAKNPANPDPTKAVLWGDQTWEEMMIGYIDYYDDASVEPAKVAVSQAK